MSTSQFDYLLNAFEQASQSEDPFHAQYAEKRTALFEYVWELERKALPPEAARNEAIEQCAKVAEEWGELSVAQVIRALKSPQPQQQRIQEGK